MVVYLEKRLDTNEVRMASDLPATSMHQHSGSAWMPLHRTSFCGQCHGLSILGAIGRVDYVLAEHGIAMGGYRCEGLAGPLAQQGFVKQARR